MPKKNRETERCVGKPNFEKPFQHTRYLPSETLSYSVEHYWFVEWLLPNAEQHTQHGLLHPSVHLSVEENNTRIWEVVTRKCSRTLVNNGKVFGVKFRPRWLLSLF